MKAERRVTSPSPLTPSPQPRPRPAAPYSCFKNEVLDTHSEFSSQKGKASAERAGAFAFDSTDLLLRPPNYRHEDSGVSQQKADPMAPVIHHVTLTPRARRRLLRSDIMLRPHGCKSSARGFTKFHAWYPGVHTSHLGEKKTSSGSCGCKFNGR